MLQIMICDDLEQDLVEIEALLTQYGIKRRIELDIRKFSKPEAVLYELQDGIIPQILILDVEMPGMDGFALAAQIREITSAVILIFLTSHEELAIRGYRVNALRYVPKLTMGTDLEEALDCAVKEIGVLDKKSIQLKRYSDLFQIPYKEIIYVKREGRVLKIKTASNGELTDPRGISEFHDIINDPRFLFIDRGCFVNIDYIKQLSGYDLTLKTGDVLPVSRRSLQTVKSALLEYWSE